MTYVDTQPCSFNYLQCTFDKRQADWRWSILSESGQITHFQHMSDILCVFHRGQYEEPRVYVDATDQPGRSTLDFVMDI